MKANLVKGIAISLMLLAISMAFVPVVSAEAVSGAETGQTACDSCGCKCGGGNADECIVNLYVTYEEFEGAEKNKAISNTLKNEEVKKLRSKLIEEGFTPAVNDAVAVKVNVVIQETGDDPHTYQTTYVVLHFRSDVEWNTGIIINSISDAEKTRTYASIINVVDVNANDVIDPDDEAHIEFYTVDEQGNVVPGICSECTDLCEVIVGTSLTVTCILFGGFPYLCAIGAAVIADFICKYLCEEPWTWCSLACSAFCAAIASKVPGDEWLQFIFGIGCYDACNDFLDEYC